MTTLLALLVVIVAMTEINAMLKVRDGFETPNYFKYRP